VGAKAKAWGKAAKREDLLSPESSEEARATGRTNKAIMTQKKDMLDDRSGDFTPCSVSKSTDIVGWYCGTGQLID
jgi:hypothetical protein